MPVDFIPAVQGAANVEAQSGWRVIQPWVALAAVQLTDPNGLWPATIDNTRHLKCYGLQIEAADGPRWWVYEGDVYDSIYLPDGPFTKEDLGGPHPDWWLAFGFHRRDGSMPEVSAKGNISVRARVRFAFLADAAITLGADFTYV